MRSRLALLIRPFLGKAGSNSLNKDATLFLAPYMLLFTLFILWPAINGLWMSFHNWDLLFPRKPFIGLQNYKDIFTPDNPVSVQFWPAVRATLIFSALTVPLLITLSLGFAVLLNKVFKGRIAMRAIIFAPYVLGAASVGLLWRYILDPNVGLLNYYLNEWGLGRPPWTNGTPWIWISLTIATIWWTIGYNTVIFIAGLQDIPREQYEAASVDGANAWKQFRSVTLPGLRPVLAFVATTTIIASANVFAQPLLITQGQPGGESRSLIMEISEEAMKEFKFGSASAMSTVFTLSILLITVLLFKLFQEKQSDGVA
jgi:multiple sugar transport system permease protein